MSICQRCHSETLATIMSMLNTQIICLDCKAKERSDPGYRAAEVKDLREYAGRMVSVHGCSQEQADNVLLAADKLERGGL
jgi:hypothetical protein